MPATLNDASLPLVSIGIVTYNQKDLAVSNTKCNRVNV